ncbi:MAG: hypothetical protein ACX931_07940 [Saccharospirillum sp.]
MAMLVGFVYLQWPTRVRTPPPIDYQVLETPPGVRLAWEGEPDYHTQDGTEVWALSRSRMEFLVQRSVLNQPLAQLAEQALDADQRRVGGAVREPLTERGGVYHYRLFDVENRIQRHQLFALDGHWIKVSALYRLNNDAHERRAAAFFDSLTMDP